MRRYTTRRSIALAVGLAAVVAAGAVASSGQGKPARKAAQRTTVTLTGWSLAGSRTEQNALLRTIAAFERSHKTIDVRYAPVAGDYDAAMLARFAARRPPDVFYVDSPDVPDYAPALQPLNSMIRRTKFNTKPFFKRLLNGFTVRGQILGIPKDWSPLGLVANTRMLARANVKAPKTWPQLTRALQRLRSRNAVPGGAPACLSLDWARLLAFIYENRGAWFNPAKTRSVINSRQNRQTLTTYLGWLRSGLARTPAQLGVSWCGEALGKEKAAIIFEGNWVVSFMQTTYPNVRFRVFPMVRNKARGNLAFTVSYSIGRNSRNKAAAWTLLSYLVGRQGMTVWTRNSGFLPSRRDVKPPAGRANFLREAAVARPWSFVRGFDRLYDYAGKELEKAAEGDQTVAETLRNIDRQTKETLSRGR
ncbi:MAG: extracellular solute-binding protein [Actinomycetota bacterium]|nr:extracellular solute-binding protein [Actinomycetota bacterium]